MERLILNEKTGESLEIPDAIVAASQGVVYDAPHHEKKIAEKGVTEKRVRRDLVEQYIAASPSQRAVLLQQAKVALGEVEVKAEEPAPAISATADTSSESDPQ